jgi:hypothetical protein
MSDDQVNELNTILDQQFEIIEELQPKHLSPIYKNQKAFAKRIKLFHEIVEKHVEDETVQTNIIKDMADLVVQPGLKGSIKGNIFNKVVQTKIETIFKEFDKNRFVIGFEKNPPNSIHSETPDWFLHDKSTGKNIIGYNQLSLWGGGQQMERSAKIFQDDDSLFVIYNHIQVKSKRKVFHMLKYGFDRKRLCYLSTLKQVLLSRLR